MMDNNIKDFYICCYRGYNKLIQVNTNTIISANKSRMMVWVWIIKDGELRPLSFEEHIECLEKSFGGVG